MTCIPDHFLESHNIVRDLFSLLSMPLLVSMKDCLSVFKAALQIHLLPLTQPLLYLTGHGSRS